MQHEDSQTRPTPSTGAPAELSDAAPPRFIGRRLLVIQIAALVIATALSVAAIPLAPQIRQVPGPGYLALFVLSVQSGALFMVPGFGFASIAFFTFVFDNIWGPALLGTTGQVIGEMVSYLLGVTGSPWIRRQRAYRRVDVWLQRWGLLTVFVIAAIPNPFFDIAGAIAGAAGLGWWRFMIASWAGRIIKNLGFALLGLQGASMIEQFLK